VEHTGLFSGGCANNTALTLAKLGVPVEIVTAVGRDEFGDFLVRNLARAGVGTAHVRRDSERHTAVSIVLVNQDGERSFLHHPGANGGLRDEHFPQSLLAQARVLHIGGALLLKELDGAPMAELLTRARAAGATVTLDTTFDRFGTGLRLLGPSFPLLDVFLANEREATALSGLTTPEDCAAFFLDRGCKATVIKMGEHGCLLATGSERRRLPAFSLPVVDTTGAGDAFAAGFVAGLVNGRSLEDCARLGCAAGGRCVGHPGASAFPTSMQDLDALM
jgi:sugar/nucleoside kinase (ribokinase family)